MTKRRIRSTVTGTAIAAGMAFGVPAAAASTPHRTFSQVQQQLEQQLTNRVTQLGRLTADVNASKTLTTAHTTLLDARLSTEMASINALVAKVPGDTTYAQLNSDRSAMLRDNRVFAVETPQVIQIIEADGIALQVTTLEANESSLQASVASLVGQPGYENALRHFEAFVASVNRAATASSNVVNNVISQVPADFPGDTHVFVNANRALYNADLALARSSYDETIIGLASGGYTGS